MPGTDPSDPAPRGYTPSMTSDYSRISATARAVDRSVEPRVATYIESIRETVARMPPGTPFVIADYGAADGANSSTLVEGIVGQLRTIDPNVAIRLVYVDIADPAPFHRFWEGSALSKVEGVEAEYIRRSFYEPFPELAGRVHLALSSTALHWFDTRAVDPSFFRHPRCIQPNQMPAPERAEFAEKWRCDWRLFLRERSHDLADGGLLVLANLADLGGDRWPASAGYDRLRDACAALHREGCLSKEELEAIFVPDYFATPDEMRAVLEEDEVRRRFSLRSLEATTVPCAYCSQMLEGDEVRERRVLAASLARVVRAWSESSVRVGLAAHTDLVDEVYTRLEDAFFERPAALPYQYCLIELQRAGADAE